jgi:pimeloyl-ACP methyl ester carboxylesterase
MSMDTVSSADGTTIAYDHVGDGPPLLVSVGAFCDRHTFVPPDDLAARFTVYTYDRRGRGDSGDTEPYAPDEDTPLPAGDPAAHIRSLVAADRRGEAVMYWMSEVVRLPDDRVAAMKNAPWLAALEPFARTLPYDIAVTAGDLPAAELAAITAPVLILGGVNSPAWFRRSVADQAAAIPGGKLRMLDGYDHNAPPEVITRILFGFFS